MGSIAKNRASNGAGRVRIWDLPTRLFHWSLVVLVTISVVTSKLGGLWLDWHMRSGYAIIALLVFRLLWGVAGSRYARLSHFVRSPGTALEYLRGQHEGPHVGHNPLGALSVLAILAVLLVQAGSGLFSNDGSFNEGPLAKLVSRATGELLSSIHRWGNWLSTAWSGCTWQPLPTTSSSAATTSSGR